MEKKPDLTDEQIETKSKEMLELLHQFTALTNTDEEDNIFHQGYHTGYREAERSLQSQNERLLSALKEMRKEVLLRWSFRDQIHTHTWHDKADFIEWFDKKVKEIQSPLLINDSGER
jgi:predicted nucleotide-binding protein (sugar kinase/HSP70/actin superfamily)